MTDRLLEPFGAEEAWIAARVRAYTDRALSPIDAAAIAHEVAARRPRMRTFGGTALRSRWFLWIVVAGLLVVTLAAALLLTGGAVRTHQRLAFVRAGDLYIAAADGTGQTQIADGRADVNGPGYDDVRWAPDGVHIAAVLEGRRAASDGSAHPAMVEVQTADGRIVDTFDLAPTGGSSVVISWAPDARHLAVLARDDAASVELAVIGLDDRAQGRIALPTGFRSYIPAVAWSPDGLQIAMNGCVCSNAKVPGLWIVAADGSASKELASSTEGSVWDPVWSPDGRRIAFSRQGTACATCPEELWVATPEDGSVRRLTGLEGVERSIAWSPDGRRLAITTHLIGPRGRSGLFVLPSDGSAVPVKLVSGETEDALGGGASGTQRVVSGEDFSFGGEDLRWSADGQRLIYRSSASDEFPGGSIREISAGGGTPRVLVANVAAFDLEGARVGD